MLQPEARLRGSWLSDTSQLHRSDVPDLHWPSAPTITAPPWAWHSRRLGLCAAACCNAHIAAGVLLMDTFKKEESMYSATGCGCVPTVLPVQLACAVQ
jgi:hypothetical protein